MTACIKLNGMDDRCLRRVAEDKLMLKVVQHRVF